jgi:hypothetical protein
MLTVQNWNFLMAGIIPASDNATDILLVQRAHHGLLLTGHYSGLGLNHPGPFFLYFRYLGDLVAGPFAGSLYGSSLFGTMAGNAFFAGLLATLLYWLAGRTMSGASAAIVGTVVVLSQFSGNHGTLAQAWMPDALLMPFLAFLVSAVLLASGSGIGLLVTTFCACALVHGYIPMPMIVGPVWVAAILLGLRTRRRSGEGGFRPRLYALAACVVGIFILPILLDVVLYPPGNIMNILAAGAKSADKAHAPLPAVFDLLAGYVASLRPWLWGFMALGLSVSVVVRRYFWMWRDCFMMVSVTTAATVLLFSRTPAPLMEYTGRFFIMVPLLPVVVGCLVLVLESARLSRSFAPMLAVASVAGFLVFGSLIGGNGGVPEIRTMSRAVAAENEPGSLVELEMAEHDVWPIVAGLLLDLDHFAIRSCVPDKRFAFLYTRERICPQGVDPARKRYRVMIQTDCGKSAAVSATKAAGTGRPIDPTEQLYAILSRLSRDDEMFLRKLADEVGYVGPLGEGRFAAWIEARSEIKSRLASRYVSAALRGTANSGKDPLTAGFCLGGGPFFGLESAGHPVSEGLR